jgi:hypothetical protein
MSAQSVEATVTGRWGPGEGMSRCKYCFSADVTTGTLHVLPMVLFFGGRVRGGYSKLLLDCSWMLRFEFLIIFTT